MNATSLALILAGVLLNAGAQLLLKAGATRLADIAWTWPNALTAGTAVLQQPAILGGLACYAVSVVLWIMALTRVPVSIAYPMLSIGYIVNAFAAWWLFGESLTAQKLAGIGFIMVGVWLVART